MPAQLAEIGAPEPASGADSFLKAQAAPQNAGSSETDTVELGKSSKRDLRLRAQR